MIKKWGWKKFGLAIMGAILGVLAFAYKIWESVVDSRSKKKVEDAKDKQETEAREDAKDTAEVVARQEGKVDVVVETIETITTTTEPATEERLVAIESEVSDMSRRRREEALRRNGRK